MCYRDEEARDMMTVILFSICIEKMGTVHIFRAARLIDMLEENEVIGPDGAGTPRQVLQDKEVSK